MVQNSSSTPATGGDTSIPGSSGADQLSGGGGNDTITGLGANDLLSGDAPLTGQWQYSVYDRDFAPANGQTSLIGDSQSTLIGHGYVDDFNILALRNTLGGTPATTARNDFGVIYRSGLQINTGGTFSFGTESRVGGSRIIIRDSSGNEVFNQNNDFYPGGAFRQGTVALQPGTYSIEVLVWHDTGGAFLNALHSGPGIVATRPLWSSVLLTEPPLAPGHVDGDDSILGDGGNDTITGGGGNDRLFGGADADSIAGDAGNDIIDAGTGNDFASGGTGDDSIEGGDGNDSISGDEGNDSLSGGGGADRIFGGAGDDTIIGGPGSDTLAGDEGNDLFVYDLGAVTAGTLGVESVFGGGEDDEPIETDNDVMDLSAYGQAYGWGSVVITPDPSDPENGTVRLYSGPPFSGTGANLLGTIAFDDIERIIRCFTPGTMILTDRGEVAVEDLVAGDLVVTRDHGLQPLRWIGRQHVSRGHLRFRPELLPVRIARGALGAAGPVRAMLVSPQHRLLISGARAELLFGEAEVLLPARHLVGVVDATVENPAEGVTYIHIMFDRHEIVRSDGLWSESFQPAERTLSAMDAAVRDEILAIFPGLAVDASGFQAAYPSLRAYESRVLLSG
jgi:serralysin